MFERMTCGDLNPRQKENYNFQRVAARMADYGFNCLRLTDDWQGADSIACHINGETFLKVQLKPRLVIDRIYQDKDIHIAFFLGDAIFIYDHDELIEYIENNRFIGAESVTWREEGKRTWPTPPRWAINYLEEFRI